MEFDSLRRLRLPVNTVGNDYFIGDLHGRYDLFEMLLINIKFDPSKDRIISVGDLVDRGPYSKKCLELLREKWFYAVLANHEEMMWMAYIPDTDPRHNWRLAQSWFGNGGTWALEDWAGAMSITATPTDDQYDLKQLVLENVGALPHVIHVEQRDGSHVHVVHAELPRNKIYTAENLQDQDFMQKMYDLSIDTRYLTHGFRWDRSIFAPLYKRNAKDVLGELKRNVQIMSSSEELIISGHTIMKQPTMIDNFLNIDTGAYLGGTYGLTCYNSRTNSFITVHDDKINHDPDVVVLSSRILEGQE